MAGRVAALATGALPGFFAGAQIAGLLFFLNPHWSTDLGAWLRTALLYCTLLGIGCFTVQLPFFLRQPRRALRALPWTLTAAFVFFGALHWWHASHLGNYLPPGINRRLIKAGALLLASGLVAFYIALLHTTQRRPYRIRARMALVVLALLGTYVIVERREAYRAPSTATPRPALVTPSPDAPRVLFVGISSLTLDAVLPLAEQGRLPFFSQLVRGGSVARLTSLSPPRHEPLWWTAVTGVLPYRLAEAGATRYAADFIAPGEVFREIPSAIGFKRWGVPGGSLPASREEPPYPPLWEVASRIGLESVAIGFSGASNPSPSPGEALPGVEPAPAQDPGLAEILPGCPGAEAFVLAMRADPKRVSPTWLSAAGRDLDLASQALQQWSQIPTPGSPTRARAVFLRLDGLREISRESFGAFSRVELDGLQRRELERPAADVERYYIFLDRLLSDLWAAEGAANPSAGPTTPVATSAEAGSNPPRSSPPATLAVVSPYGVRSLPDGLMPWATVWPRLELEGTFGGAPDGTLLLAGAGIRTGTVRAELTDVAATVAYLLGLPVARDLDGSVVAAVFDPQFLAAHPLRFVPSYGTVARPAGARTSVGLLPERPTSP